MQLKTPNGIEMTRSIKKHHIPVIYSILKDKVHSDCRLLEEIEDIRSNGFVRLVIKDSNIIALAMGKVRDEYLDLAFYWVAPKYRNKPLSFYIGLELIGIANTKPILVHTTKPFGLGTMLFATDTKDIYMVSIAHRYDKYKQARAS